MASKRKPSRRQQVQQVIGTRGKKRRPFHVPIEDEVLVLRRSDGLQSPSVTEVYVERDTELARRTMARFG